MSATFTTPGPAVMRFSTLCGAVVAVTRDTVRPGGTAAFYTWRCLGCDAEGVQLHKPIARTEANQHAGQCRAIPKDSA
jgi:hypothetical protein